MRLRTILPALLLTLATSSWCRGQDRLQTVAAVDPEHPVMITFVPFDGEPPPTAAQPVPLPLPPKTLPPTTTPSTPLAPSFTPLMPPAQEPQEQPGMPRSLMPRTTADLVMSGYGVGPGQPLPAWQAWCDKSWNGLCDFSSDEFHKVVCDFKHMYWGKNLVCMGVALAAAAPLANTHADQGIRDWYVERLKTSSGDGWASVAYQMGKHFNVIPVYAIVGGVGLMFPDTWVGSTAFTWGERSLRSLLVGVPAVGILQVGLGGSRPNENGPHSSYWHPLHDNNSVSGHAFVGSIPFLVAASMTENPWMKGAFFLGSFFVPWARVQQDAHYFSQVALGWTFGFLAAQSVLQTDIENRRVLVAPLDVPGTQGIGVMFRY